MNIQSKKVIGVKPETWHKAAIEYLLFWHCFSQKRIAVELKMHRTSVSRYMRKNGWLKKIGISQHAYRETNKNRVKRNSISFMLYLKIREPILSQRLQIRISDFDCAIDLVMHSKIRQPELYDQLTTAHQQYLKTF